MRSSKPAIDRLGPGDILIIGLEAAMESSIGITLFPAYSLCCILAGIPVVVVWNRFKKTITGHVIWVPVLLAFTACYVMKLIFLPRFLSYVPFSA